MSSHVENLMEEWKVLRGEIARKQDFAERLVLTTVAGNLAIYSFTFSLQRIAPINAFIALVPIILTTVSYFWMLRSVYSGLRIVRYIKEYIEPNVGLYWETWVHLSRRPTQPRGEVRIGEDIYRLLYYFFLVVSLVMCMAIIWGPSDGTVQLPRDRQIRVWCTLGATLSWIVCHSLAWHVLIARRVKDIETLNREIQGLGNPVIQITNPKIAGLDPGWAPFRGFSLLFDNPKDLQLYKGFQEFLMRIPKNQLMYAYLFWPLPSDSYYVTVWTGLNESHSQDVLPRHRQDLGDFLSDLPHSLHTRNVFVQEIDCSSLVTSTYGTVTLRFDKLDIWRNKALVAYLVPADIKSEEEFKRIDEARKLLSRTFRDQFGVDIGSDYRPHVTLGYFANESYAELATAQVDQWTKEVREIMNNPATGTMNEPTIIGSTISLYGFTDAVTFHK